MATRASFAAGAGSSICSMRRSPAACATTAKVMWDRVLDDNAHASVDENGLPVHVVRSTRGQPHCWACQVLDGSPAASRGAAQDPGVEFLVIHQILRHFGVDIARCDAVDLKSCSGPFCGHGAGEIAQSALGRGVGGDGGSGQVGLHRTDVDDLAFAAFYHATCDFSAY